ncbi:MAG: phosphopentomutase [Candidatus Zixiibacteriota bacterium]
MYKRIIIVILDACGVGELPDADQYGDVGANTIPNVARSVGGLNLPNLQKLGLGNIVPIDGVPPSDKPLACFGKMTEKSPGKDSTTGHWEIGGIILDRPFPVYPDGFPESLVEEFKQKADVRTIGNVTASGTEIIKQLGEEHVNSGALIIYTSADSVFQLAAHEDIIPLERLYEICRIARELLTGQHAVGRVIARPFIGTPGTFERTTNRKDFSLVPPSPTFLDLMQKKNIPTISIGKIYDLFAHRGFSLAISAKNNMAVVDNVIDALKTNDYGLIFANLVDFDMLWGHRNDTESFARGLEQFDRRLPDIIGALTPDDLLIITADHGCDPTLKDSTDHTREYVPILAHNIGMKRGTDLGARKTMADIAVTVAKIFKLDYNFPGIEFTNELKESQNDTKP